MLMSQETQHDQEQEQEQEEEEERSAPCEINQSKKRRKRPLVETLTGLHYRDRESRLFIPRNSIELQ